MWNLIKRVEFAEWIILGIVVGYVSVCLTMAYLATGY